MNTESTTTPLHQSSNERPTLAGYHFGLALSSWRATLRRMLSSNPGVGSPLYNPTQTSRIYGTWLWITAPVLTIVSWFLAFLFLKWDVERDLPGYMRTGPFEGLGPLFKIALIVVSVILVMRGVGLVIISSFSGRNLSFGEGFNLAAIPMVIAPLFALAVVLIQLMSLSGSFVVYLMAGFLAFIVLITELSLYTAFTGRGQFGRSITTVYAAFSAICFTVSIWIILELINSVFLNQYLPGFGF